MSKNAHERLVKSALFHLLLGVLLIFAMVSGINGMVSDNFYLSWAGFILLLGAPIGYVLWLVRRYGPKSEMQTAQIEKEEVHNEV